jgi:hypothetical protein
MAAPESEPTATHLPPELTTAVMADAARDADRVGQFLADLGLRGDAKKPLALPERFLLYLGAALRLQSWETQGFTFHREAGLPEARHDLDQAFQSVDNPNAEPRELCLSVLRLAIERMAWHGRRDLGADVALDDLIDDAALDALAEFFWASRHAGAVTRGPQP